MDRSRYGSLRSRLSGIATCRGDSRRFPVLAEGCSFAHDGPSLQVNSSCFLIKGVMRIGAGRGSRDEDGPVIFLIGGSGISSGVGDLFQGAGIIGVASLRGGDGVSDGGRST